MTCAPHVAKLSLEASVNRDTRSVGRVNQSKLQLSHQRASRAVNSADANVKPNQPYIGGFEHVNEGPSKCMLIYGKMTTLPTRYTVRKQKQADPVNTRRAKDIITSVQKNEGRGRHLKTTTVQMRGTYPETARHTRLSTPRSPKP